MSSKLIGVVGETGTGKSTAIKHLDPKETYIINVAKKELPFKGSGNFTTQKTKTTKRSMTQLRLLDYLRLFLKRPHI